MSPFHDVICCICCRCLIECRDEYKYNVEAVELLIRNHLVNMQQYDLHLAQVHITHFHLVIHNFIYYLFILFFEFGVKKLCSYLYISAKVHF